MNRAAVFLFFLCIFLTTMSGTIASSDGYTMMQLTRAIVDREALDVPGGNTLRGPDGKEYPKAGLGQALLGVPVYWAASRLCDAVPALGARREAFVRFALQLLGPLVSALLCLTFLSLLRRLGAPPRPAFLATLLLGLATPVWVYAKSYLTEPWTSWLLLLAMAALWRFRREGRAWDAAWAGLAVGFAVLIKAAMVLPGAALGLYFLYVWLRERRAWSALLAAALPLLACMALVLWYNHARFGTWGESGYGVEQTAVGYTTPLYVGLYGQLLSAGKGLFWYAPPLLLLLGTWNLFRREFPAESLTVLGVALPSLLLNATFRAWAGDGSWGPRYLIPFVPLFMLPVGLGLAGSRRKRRFWAPLLLTLGILVQWAGVSIYYGSYLRESGAYPYTRRFEDPRFLEDVHWVPNFSPIVGHWGMFQRNLSEHLAGRWPHVAVTPGPAPAEAPGAPALPGEPKSPGARIPLSQEDQSRLLHGIDFWFLYLMYVGAAGPGVLVAPVLLLLMAAAAGWVAWRSCARAEGAEA